MVGLWKGSVLARILFTSCSAVGLRLMSRIALPPVSVPLVISERGAGENTVGLSKAFPLGRGRD